uniref:Replication protein A OB domain-containing protein n=1 Tax=Ananas comosus var. bracteatus TaxID=296719 RepID=A0A6V7P5G7_ANACO|nr:unnamed protein product [Ananas comosus var. bracteatus]
MKFNFVYLNALHAYITGDKLIVIAIGDPITAIKKSDGSEIVRRELTIIDHLSPSSVKLILWENLTTVEGYIIKKVIQDRPILIATSLKVQNFKGISLSTTSNTMLEINPSIKEAKDLTEWISKSLFDTDEMNKIQNITNAVRMKNERATIKEITGDLVNASKQEYNIDQFVRKLESCLKKSYLLTIKVAEAKRGDVITYNYTGISIEKLDGQEDESIGNKIFPQSHIQHDILETNEETESTISQNFSPNYTQRKILEDDEEALVMNITESKFSRLRKRKMIIDDEE